MRIEQYDERGNRIAPLPVEVRALHLRGQVAEGEEVVADGRWRRGTLSARRVTNVTTGATIQGAHLILRKVVPLVIAVIMLGGTLVAAGWFMRTMNDATVEAFAEANQDMSLNSGFGNDPFDSPGGRSDVAVEVTLPDLRGVDAVTAISRLEQLGLRWRALQERSPSVPYGRVLRTEPAQDERARTGSVVVVHVSGGP